MLTIITLYLNLKSQHVIDFNQCLGSVCNWLLFNDLLLNADKSQYTVVGTRHQIKTTLDPKIKIDDDPIPKSNNMKLLGVSLDQTLSFDKHISDICSASHYHLKALQHV